jgi:hypothetical protein
VHPLGTPLPYYEFAELLPTLESARGGHQKAEGPRERAFEGRKFPAMRGRPKNPFLERSLVERLK